MVTARPARIALVLSLFILATGCAVFRGIPTHGGGKRFDEEERAVAGAVRCALANMDLSTLRGKTVMVNLEAISHNGGGYITFPGVSGLSLGYNKNDYNNHTDYTKDSLPGWAYNPDGTFRTEYYNMASLANNQSNSISSGYNAGISFNNMSFSSSAFGSDADLAYLRSSLTMKLQHDGINVVGATPEYVLYVLVDVLGMNRSRRDSLIYWTDTLRATCELTYYAQNAADGQLFFRARQSAAASEYQEASVPGFNGFRIRRTLQTIQPTPLPVDGEPGLKVKFSKDQINLPGLHSEDDEVTTATLPRTSLHSDVQIKDAELQLQIGNLNEARRLIDAVRQTNPSQPGLIDVESKLQQREQEIAPLTGKP